jgi:hypothetical protein
MIQVLSNDIADRELDNGHYFSAVDGYESGHQEVDQCMDTAYQMAAQEQQQSQPATNCRLKRYFVVIGLSSGSASSIRTHQCLAENDARVTSRYADAGHYIALHLPMPAKQSTITSMAASDAADGFPPGIEVP